MADAGSIRVLIADDQMMVREGLSVLLGSRPDIEVAGEAADGREAVEAVLALRPDVALLDVRMPVMSGLEATREIVARAPATKVLILTTYDLDEYVYKALKAGAGGFLLKDAPVARLAEGVRAVAAGGALLAPPVTRRLITEFSRLTGEDAALRAPLLERVAGLTERETHVLALVAQGLSNAEIAGHLDLAESTVKTHVGRVLMKLSLRDRTQAVVFAYESGVVAARASAAGTADAGARHRRRRRGG
ncbi:two component transcriptional regulator, LuxR family [Streptomyces sp. WMMB 714]|uniref:response regulator transcription factor n=1 Tax=Streptomyces sp. WMMB 714 TaxID=1286822 RepID=UPI00082381FA|nr:response regulator transcription factor [Streptomyces sp. WMMB 714]SCK23910.1 two component transcriptional regulator, LuxR family [Streptomyces sp. WMMB 714]